MFTAKNLFMSTSAIALAVALASCASAPRENARLTSIESDLKSAYGDKYVAEYGHDDLSMAETSLAAARVAIQKRRDDETNHELTMAEGHIALGEIHGRQERAKAETIALKDRQDRIRLSARDRDVREANDRAATSRADANAANAANDDAQAASKLAEQKLAAMRQQLSSYEMKITELGATLVLRDVMFDVDSAMLRAGAVNRLDPLITYLRASPEISVRVDGHTDSTGSAMHNRELSLDRANSVKRALLSNTSVSNRIETQGFGQDKPIASNETVSGREQNRRVEITLF